MQNLSAAELLLVYQIQLINRGVILFVERVFAVRERHRVLVIQDRIFAVVHERHVRRDAMNFVVRPNESLFQLRTQIRSLFLVRVLQAGFVAAEGVHGEGQSPR